MDNPPLDRVGHALYFAVMIRAGTRGSRRARNMPKVTPSPDGDGILQVRRDSDKAPDTAP